jgi:hypothetical protein
MDRARGGVRAIELAIGRFGDGSPGLLSAGLPRCVPADRLEQHHPRPIPVLGHVVVEMRPIQCPGRLGHRHWGELEKDMEDQESLLRPVCLHRE